MSTFVVNVGGVGIACPNASGLSTHTTVQAAVTAALGDPDPVVVVEICPGTYVENVTVDEATMPLVKNITIRGVGSDKTQVTINGGGSPGPIINVVSAGSVHLSNLTVDGQSTMAPAPDPPVVGIRFGLVDGTIQNVLVQNIRDVAGTAAGIGILAVGQDMMMFDPMNPPTERSLQIQQCMVMNATHAAIMGDGQGINVTVLECSLMGPIAPLQHAPNGFQISRGAKGRIVNSEISNFKSPLPTVGAGSGIVFLCPAVNSGGVAVAERNLVRNSDLGVSLVDSDGVRVDGNTIIDTEIGITMQSQGISSPSPICFPPLVPPQNSQILSNIIRNATEAGVQAASFSATPGVVPRMNNVEDNLIMSDPIIAMAPIAVSSGQDNLFLSNLIFVGANSGIVDFGSNNTFLNFCFPDDPAHPCSPLSLAQGLVMQSHDVNALLPPARPAFPCILPPRLPLNMIPTPTSTSIPTSTPTMMPVVSTATPTPTPTGVSGISSADTIPTLDWRGLALLIGLLLLFGVMALRRLQV